MYGGVEYLCEYVVGYDCFWGFEFYDSVVFYGVDVVGVVICEVDVV